MNEEQFNNHKQRLYRLIQQRLIVEGLSITESESLTRLSGILDRYSFENRLAMKGLLSHAIIDSLTLDNSIGEEFIRFDKSIK